MDGLQVTRQDEWHQGPGRELSWATDVTADVLSLVPGTARASLAGRRVSTVEG